MGTSNNTPANRSPKHPLFGLPEAIERTRDLYSIIQHRKADKQVVANGLGYSSLNGASLGVIATLKQYGLLEAVGDGLKVSDDGVTILELPPGNPEKLAAIRKAALAPKLFVDLKESFGDRLFSDESLRLHLLRKGFNRKAADLVIRAYRETIGLAEEGKSEYHHDQLEPKSREALIPLSRQQYPASQNLNRLFDSSMPSSVVLDQEAFDSAEKFDFRVSADCRAKVIFDGCVTREAIRKLMKYLALSLDDFPTRDDQDEQNRRDRIDAAQDELEEELNDLEREMGQGDS